MKVITAVEKIETNDLIERTVRCFLAGGITNCANWQNEVISKLKEYDVNNPGELNELIVFNPRRDDFPIDDPDASYEQIDWEFSALEKSDIFSMRFVAGPSDQPICMYELGRIIHKMQIRYPVSFKDRVIISCDKDYKRAQDVHIQMKLATGYDDIVRDMTIDEYANKIIESYKKLRDKYKKFWKDRFNSKR